MFSLTGLLAFLAAPPAAVLKKKPDRITELQGQISALKLQLREAEQGRRRNAALFATERTQRLEAESIARALRQEIANLRAPRAEEIAHLRNHAEWRNTIERAVCHCVPGRARFLRSSDDASQYLFAVEQFREALRRRNE